MGGPSSTSGGPKYSILQSKLFYLDSVQVWIFYLIEWWANERGQLLGKKNFKFECIDI
jgi:hypothetical protein